jgi:ABC-type glutathione transport system ATPase component
MNGENKLITTNANKVAESEPSAIPRRKCNRPVQLSWEDIVITAMPPKGRCKPKNALKEPKQIIKGVSGTVLPGQFLAIIGASGKS